MTGTADPEIPPDITSELAQTLSGAPPALIARLTSLSNQAEEVSGSTPEDQVLADRIRTLVSDLRACPQEQLVRILGLCRGSEDRVVLGVVGAIHLEAQ